MTSRGARRARRGVVGVKTGTQRSDVIPVKTGTHRRDVIPVTTGIPAGSRLRGNDE